MVPRVFRKPLVPGQGDPSYALVNARLRPESSKKGAPSSITFSFAMHGGGFTLPHLCVNRLANKCQSSAIVYTKSCRTFLPYAILSVEACLLTVLMFAQLKLGANGFSYQGRYDYLADYKVQRLQYLQSLAAIQKSTKKNCQQHYLQVATTMMDTFPYLAALRACLCIWPTATCL